MKYLLYLMILVKMTSCQSYSNIYNNIEYLQNSYNEDNKSKISLGKRFNPTKIIIHQLKSKLKSDNVIYVFSWANTMPMPNAKQFSALLYDSSTENRYYAYNHTKSYKNIIVTEHSKAFVELDYLLHQYINTKSLEQLKPYERQAISSEMGETYYLFDTQDKKVYKLEDLVFEKGKLIKYED